MICLLSASAPAQQPGPEPASHAARARLLEELGKTAEAAAEYRAAFAETRAPELLYRLALCQRTLGQYKEAREALRGYLRDAPDGPLRLEVERQLSELSVLIEARGLQAPAPAEAARGAHHAHAPARPSPASSPNGAPPTDSTATAAATVSPVAPAASSPETTAPLSSAPPRIAAAAAPPAAPAIPETETPVVTVSAPPDALAQAPAAAPPRSRAAAPWLAGGAVALAGAGTALCIGGHQIAGDLDAKFAAGTLTAADQPRYGKARAEGIAGTSLLAAAALAATLAAVLAW